MGLLPRATVVPPTTAIRCFAFIFIMVTATTTGERPSSNLYKRRKALFIHIGKAGGGTILDWIKYNGMSDDFETGHPHYRLSSSTPHDHVLVNLRDPVSRATSAVACKLTHALSFYIHTQHHLQSI